MSRRRTESGDHASSQGNGTHKRRKFMDSNLTQDERAETARKFHDIEDDIKRRGKTALESDDATYVPKTLGQIENVFKEVSFPKEACVGVKGMGILTDLVLQTTASKARDSTWNLTTILKALGSKYNLDDYGNNEEEHAVDWVAIGREGAPYFSHVRTAGFMNGPLLSEVKDKKRTERKKRDEREEEGDIVTAKALQKGDIQIDETINTAQRSLNVYKNLRFDHPMSFFEFVVNPNSFTETVENTFDLSCAIKAARVGMTFRNGYPEIFRKSLPAISDKQTKDPEMTENQILIEWTYDDWKRVVKELNITKSFLEPRRDRDPTSGLESLELAAEDAPPRAEEHSTSHTQTTQTPSHLRRPTTAAGTGKSSGKQEKRRRESQEEIQVEDSDQE